MFLQDENGKPIYFDGIANSAYIFPPPLMDIKKLVQTVGAAE